MAREHYMVRRRVLIRPMRQRATERPHVAPRGQHRKVFANLESGSLGRYWAKLTANVLWGIGLEVKTLMLSQTARKKNEDTGLGLSKCSPACSLRLAQPEQVIRSQTQNPNGANLHRLAAPEPSVR